MATLKQMKLRITTDDNVYPGLKKFKVHGKELVDLPWNLFNLLELEYLVLSPERETCLSFQLSKIPKEICQLAQLKVLILDTNLIQSLPEEICMLKSLERLTLSNNQLQSLPAHFSQLKSLQSLHCANNKFVCIPEQIMSLSKLSFLDFSDNSITVLPQNIGKLKNLTTLLLSYNRISALPESLTELSSLQTLWLGGNNINELPQNFGKLKHLDWSQWCSSSVLDGNPLTTPPLHIAKLGTEAIERYFHLKHDKTITVESKTVK